MSAKNACYTHHIGQIVIPGNQNISAKNEKEQPPFKGGGATYIRISRNLIE